MAHAHRTTILAICLAVLATLLVVITPPPAAEAATPRPSPAVWDIAPATGEVVDAGRTTIKATAIASSGVRSIEVRLDDAVVPHEIVDRSGTATRVYATTDVAPGEHVVSFRFTDGDGKDVQRTWRIAGSPVGLQRLEGPDRYATAVQIASADRAPREAPAAVLARGDDHADALAGVPLAHHLGGPLLLTESASLPSVTANALSRLVAPGGVVHLLGGPAAIDGAVADAVRDLGFEVVRHAGENRYQTAARVARELPDVDAAVIASGSSFPDALAAAAPAAQAGEPILLSAGDQLPGATRSFIEGLSRVTLVGGPVVLSDAVKAQAAEVVPKVRRIAGEDRYQTARKVLRGWNLDGTGEALGLASGETFPDALTGALDAARRGTGLLLTDDRRLPGIVRPPFANLSPDVVRVYGGEVAVHGGVAAEARNAVRDGGPAVIEENPSVATEIHSLDQLSLKFQESLDVPATSISVQFGGRELPTSFATGDFDDTLVLDVGALTVDPNVGDAVPVRVVGVVRSDSGWTHVDRTWIYRKISVSSGDQGVRVKDVQERLRSLGYWLGTPDGKFGTLTVQAVMAFQKYERLPITGRADDATMARLPTAQRPSPTQGTGTYVEIDKNRQIIMFARNGTTQWTMNVSTGSEVPYDEEGGSGSAITPTGVFDVCYERDYLRESDLGTLWRPKYFQCGRGIAVHGATSVPSYPASHGCVRVTYPAMNFIWEQNLMPMGRRVVVHGSIPG